MIEGAKMRVKEQPGTCNHKHKSRLPHNAAAGLCKIRLSARTKRNLGFAGRRRCCRGRALSLFRLKPFGHFPQFVSFRD